MTATDDSTAVDRAEERGSICRPSVSDHRVFLFFPFSIGSSRHRARDLATLRERLSAAPLSSLAGSPLMPSWVQAKAASIAGNMWHERCRTVSDDLHPHVRRLAGGDDAEEPALTRSISYELDPDGVNMLTGKQGAAGDGLQYSLSRTAAERLRPDLGGVPEPGPLAASIRIKDVTLQFWRSAIGFLLMELEYQNNEVTDRANLVLEMNHAVCRVHGPGHCAPKKQATRITWQTRSGKAEFENEPGPTLDALAMELLRLSVGAAFLQSPDGRPVADALIRPDWPRDHRLFVYSFVAFDGPMPAEERDRYALRLSHRYTTDYSVALSDVAGLYLPFDNVAHAADVEGGAVIVNRVAGVQFLEDFKQAAVRSAYLPLAIVALHELRYLLRLSQESVAHAPEGRGFARQIRNLAQLSQEFAYFKLYFRFSQASNISHQNATHALWREALRLNQLLEEATGDVEQAHVVLSERRWRVYGTLGTFFVAYLSLTHIVDLLLDTVLNREDVLASAQVQALTGLMTVQRFDAVRHAFSVQQQIGYLLALVAAAAVAALVFKLAPSSRL